MKLCIKERREALGLTQVQVADAMGVKRVTYTKWETGDIRVYAEKLPALAALFHCSIDDLFKKDPQ